MTKRHEWCFAEEKDEWPINNSEKVIDITLEKSINFKGTASKIFYSQTESSLTFAQIYIDHKKLECLLEN